LGDASEQVFDHGAVINGYDWPARVIQKVLRGIDAKNFKRSCDE
jgi:hypothetical protein